MIYTDMTRKAMKLCFEAHKNQVDKSGVPYVFHPFHVAESMIDEDSTVVALLHDVIEDTDHTIEDLKAMGFNDEVLEALTLMTHKKDEDYYRYIKRIRRNELAKFVKLSDLKHNSDLSRLDHEPTAEDMDRYIKYRTSIYMLESRVFSLQSQGNGNDCFIALVGRRENNVICSDKDGMKHFTINPNIIIDIAQKGEELLDNNELTHIEATGDSITRHEFVISDGDTRYIWGSCDNLSLFSDEGYAGTNGRKILDFIKMVSEELINNGIDEKYLKLI